MDKTDVKGCMACSCPCEAHKEHNHPADMKQEDGTKVCAHCGSKHADGGTCAM